MATLTVYPSPGSVSPMDGTAFRTGVNQTFSAIRSGAGNSSSVGTGTIFAELDASTTTNQFSQLLRTIICFDTSPLTAGAIISSVVFSFVGTSKNNTLGVADLHIAGATPASTSTIVDADFGQCQTTSFGSVTYAAAVVDSVTYNNITLNASGISNVSLTGVSKFSYQISWDINNSFTGSWASGIASSINGYSADGNAGTSKDPKLTITYTIVGSTGNMFQLF